MVQPLVAYLLLVLSAVPAVAQRANLSYIGYPCCLAGDGHGNVFAVSYVLTPAHAMPNGTTVAKMDAGGNIISTFTFQVGANDNPLAAAVDPQGNLWIAGSTGYPAVRGLLAELDSTGTRVLFSGSFGGNDPKGTTAIRALAFDAKGNAYLGGSTSQSDFPLTPGGFIGKFGGGPTQYGFVASLSPRPTAGYTIAYTALLGGEQLQIPSCPAGGQCSTTPPASSVSAVAVDSGGVVTAAGITDAADFPVTPGAFQTQCQCSDATTSAFVTRLNAQGSGLVFSTLLGSPNLLSGIAMTVGGIALDSGGNAVVDGTTAALTFPVTSGVVQPVFATGRSGGGNNAFVAKLDNSGSRLLFSTYYGGAVVNQVSAPRLDSQGNIWISEQLSDTTGLVLRKDSLTLGAGLIAELAADGSSVLFSELLPDGVIGQDLLLNADGSLTAAGPARNFGFLPFLATGYALRHPMQGPSGISILGAADSAHNEVSSTVAPGEYISIYGTGLGPDAGVAADPGAGVAPSLAGTQVSFDGIAAPVLYASGNQLNVLAPYEIAGRAQVQMQITTPAGVSQTLPFQVVPEQPNVFAVQNSDGSVNSPSNPARPGSMVSIFVSGAGALNSGLPDGALASSPAPSPLLPVNVDFTYTTFVPFAIQSVDVPVTPAYAASVPGSVVNLLRIDAQVPALPPQASGFQISVHVGSATSPPFPVSTPAGN